MRKFVMTLAAAAALGTSALTAHALEQVAPGFSLPNPDGKVVNLSDFKDQVVVLEWYNKDCPFVRKHYDSQNMQNLQKAYGEQDVAWLTIISSNVGTQGYLTAEEAKEVMAKEGSNAAELLFDTAGDVARMYGAQVTPHMYVIDKEGNIAYRGAIDSIKSADIADVEKADKYFVNAVDAVLADQPVEKPATVAYGCNIKFE